ncbi:hypothetical protein FGIG_08380 [Fasciola gigantica]|uniref:Uncharacterized protein n=1 Tax=Fasciola gigantica TaxID=46835 RepID=A0A504YIK2_FASGI|nr:hypothetical protein FGIG_08380 [Fasciola gigantica]
MTPCTHSTEGVFKARPVDLAHHFRVTKCSQHNLITLDQINALKNLEQNKPIVIVQPDKGSGAAMLNKDDCVRKMVIVLSHCTRFQIDSKKKDKTKNLEKVISFHLKRIWKKGSIDARIFADLRPLGSRIQKNARTTQIAQDRCPFTTHFINGELTSTQAGPVIMQTH